MSIVSNAIKAAHAATRQLHGETVTFARGDSISVEMSDIVQGRTEWRGMGKGGMVVISESVDWLIPVADLGDTDGTEIEPQRGDTITVVAGDVAYTYDVQHFGPDELLWRWHDRQGRTIRRVFTKLLSEDS